MPESVARALGKVIFNAALKTIESHIKGKLGVIMVFHPLDTLGGQASYFSNITNRRDVVRILKELEKRLRQNPSVGMDLVRRDN